MIVFGGAESDSVVHVDDSIDAVRDLDTIQHELCLKDLEYVERAIADEVKDVKKSPGMKLSARLPPPPISLLPPGNSPHTPPLTSPPRPSPPRGNFQSRSKRTRPCTRFLLSFLHAQRGVNKFRAPHFWGAAPERR